MTSGAQGFSTEPETVSTLGFPAAHSLDSRTPFLVTEVQALGLLEGWMERTLNSDSLLPCLRTQTTEGHRTVAPKDCTSTGLPRVSFRCLTCGHM